MSVHRDAGEAQRTSEGHIRVGPKGPDICLETASSLTDGSTIFYELGDYEAVADGAWLSSELVLELGEWA